MRDLIQSLRDLQPKLERYRRRPLRETPTRTVFIDPILEALGWDVRDPDVVELEYATPCGKVVDYALKLHHRPVLLVEAKCLHDRLTNGKGVSQVFGYAASTGTIWCILTNGATWQVHRYAEEGAMPSEPVFEVSIAASGPARATLLEVAEQMWCFSREAFAQRALDAIGAQTTLDMKVRRGLDCLISQPPERLVKAVQETIGDRKLEPRRIKESLARVWSALGCSDESATDQEPPGTGRPRAGVPAMQSVPPRTVGRNGSGPGLRRGVADLFRAIDRLCLATAPGATKKRDLERFVAYSYRDRDFCWVRVRSRIVSVALRLASRPVQHESGSSRAAAGAGRREDVIVLSIRRPSQLDATASLIRQAFEGLHGS